MSENREYVSRSDELGNIHISGEVLASIAAAAALEVEGVSGLSANLGSDIAELLSNKKNLTKGVHIQVEDEQVTVELAVLMSYGHTIPEVGRAVQDAVKSSVESMTGLTVAAAENRTDAGGRAIGPPLLQDLCPLRWFFLLFFGKRGTLKQRQSRGMRAGPKGDRVVPAGRGVVRRTNSADARQCMIPHPAAAYRGGTSASSVRQSRKGCRIAEGGVFFMYRDQCSKTLYRTPLQPGWWLEGNQAMKSLKLLMFAALMVAMARALSLIPGIPIAHTKMTWGFLARALCALVCGPVMGLVFGFVEDILGFILQPTGDFFPGYTLSTMAGVLVYALCFYRARITVLRIVLANLVVNLLVNALMGSLWNLMLRGGVYWGWFLPSLGKNLVTVLPKTLVIYVLFQALLPILQQMGVIPRQLDEKGRLPLI